MRTGYWIVAIFAAVWASAGLILSGYPFVAIAVPIAISLGVIVAAYAIPATAAENPPHVGKLIARWSMIEGAAIFIVANILQNTGHRDALFPAFVIIVGLHFLPLARGIPVRAYYWTGLALIAIGGVALMLPPGERPLTVGLCAAVTLWATALYRLWRVSASPATVAVGA